MWLSNDSSWELNRPTTETSEKCQTSTTCRQQVKIRICLTATIVAIK